MLLIIAVALDTAGGGDRGRLRALDDAARSWLVRPRLVDGGCGINTTGWLEHPQQLPSVAVCCWAEHLVKGAFPANGVLREVQWFESDPEDAATESWT